MFQELYNQHLRYGSTLNLDLIRTYLWNYPKRLCAFLDGCKFKRGLPKAHHFRTMLLLRYSSRSFQIEVSRRQISRRASTGFLTISFQTDGFMRAVRSRRLIRLCQHLPLSVRAYSDPLYMATTNHCACALEEKSSTGVINFQTPLDFAICTAKKFRPTRLSHIIRSLNGGWNNSGSPYQRIFRCVFHVMDGAVLISPGIHRQKLQEGIQWSD